MDEKIIKKLYSLILRGVSYNQFKGIVEILYSAKQNNINIEQMLHNYIT